MNGKHYIFIIITLILSCTTQLYAQEANSVIRGFKKGFIIKSNGDTVRGKIINPFRNGISATVYFHYKRNKPVKYGPFDLAGFVFNRSGKVYTANEVPGRKGIELMFVRLLIDGEYDLLYFDNFGTAHFLIKSPSGKITDLSGKPGNQDYFISNISDSLFKQNLKLAFADNPEFLSEYGRIKNTKRSLIKLLSNYNFKNGIRYINYDHFGKKIFPEIIIGSGFNRFVPSSTIKDLQSAYGPSPYIGLGLHAANTNSGTGVFLQSVFSLSSFHVNHIDPAPPVKIYNESFIKSYISTTRAGFSLEPFKKRIINPFIEIGPMASLLISPKYENYHDVISESTGIAFSSHDHAKLYPDTYYGGFVRAGVSVNKRRMNPLRISLGYDYMLSNGDPRISSLGLELMYSLKFR
jgi:hypothetical protein